MFKKTLFFFFAALTAVIIFSTFISPASAANDYTLLEPGVYGQQKGTASPNDFGVYASWTFRALLSFIIALSIIYIVAGGFQYLTTATSLGKSEGKDKVWGAIGGLVLALISYLILYTINPDLINWKFCVPPIGSTNTCPK